MVKDLKGARVLITGAANGIGRATAEAFAAAANRFRIKLAPEYAILTKATATLEGIVRTWHPHIDLVAIVNPDHG